MKNLNINDFKAYKDFFIYEVGKIKVVFSNATNNRSFNRNLESGIENLNSLKKDFDTNEVIYIKQIHSDNIFVYDGKENIIDNEGDAIITNVKKALIGVFTADCVPVIIVNEKSGVVAAIHSGWRGTFESITKKTIEKMSKEYNINLLETKVFIGPHIRQCCYEVSEELKEKFINKVQIDEEKLFRGRNLSMEECIRKDVIESGILEENLYSFNLCTHCTDETSLFSYRKSEGTYGRLFSFAFVE